jgi:ABC-type dipeptide/oligopeptide/nickel transport system permease subunit
MSAAEQRSTAKAATRTLTGIDIMRGEGLVSSRGFWTEAWSQVIRRPRAMFSLAWIGLVGFFAAFAPVIASGHPWVMWEIGPDGRGPATSPLLRSLSAVDWLLIIGAVVFAPLMALPIRYPRTRRLGLAVASTVQAGLIVVLSAAAISFGSLNDAVVPTVIVIAAAVGALFCLIPTFQSVAARVIICALVSVVASTAILACWNPAPAVFPYAEREQAGEIEAVYTLIPWSPSQRFGDRDSKILPPGSTSDQALARILVSGLPTTGPLDDSGVRKASSRIATLPLPPPQREALAEAYQSVAATPMTREETRAFFLAQLEAHGHAYVLGTDNLGQDVLSQMMHAARLAISIGLVSTTIAVLIGVTIGSIMGYFGGIVDLLLYRVVEIFMAVPVLFLLIVAAAVLPRNTYAMMAIIGCFTWTTAARFTRAEFYKLRSQDFVQAAQALGLPLRSILFKHILPNGVTPVLVDASFLIAAAILAEATLSYLGLGPPEQASWGKLLASAFSEIGDFVWWLAIFPGFAIFLTVLSYNLLGEAFRDAIDPKLKKAAH